MYSNKFGFVIQKINISKRRVRFWRKTRRARRLAELLYRSWTGLDMFGHDQVGTFRKIYHVAGLEIILEDFSMILHGFCSMSSEIII